VPPWLVDEIDCGFASVPTSVLEAWVFGLLEDITDDWPAARSQVWRARCWLRGDLGIASIADVEFTADLLARTLEADLELPMTTVVAVLDRLGVPIDAVPLRNP
jgi:hypothetical protein